MTAIRKPVPENFAPGPCPGVAVGREASVLENIRSRSIGLVVWRRILAPRLAEAAAACARQPVHMVFEADVEDAAIAGDPSAALGAVLDDAAALARSFARLVDAQRVQLRIETVADDGCRLFHHDAVGLRLVTTWHGPGTQWVRPEWSDAARAAQTRYDGPVECLEPGDVAVFRGQSGGDDGLILHRSPPLGPNAAARLVGVIDLADMAGNEGASTAPEAARTARGEPPR